MLLHEERQFRLKENRIMSMTTNKKSHRSFEIEKHNSLNK